MHIRRLDERALFTDQTRDYLTIKKNSAVPKLSIRLRAGVHDIDRCELVAHGDHFFMRRIKEDALFAYYQGEIPFDGCPMYYYFELVVGSLHIFYTKNGVKEVAEEEDGWYFVPVDQYPSWAEGAVMYQIYVDRFYNGDLSNDVLTGEYAYEGAQVRRVEDWTTYPGSDDRHQHYGGDLQGVMDKLPYLKSLGVQAIYLNPIFISPSNHKYDTQDYDYIDPHFGVIVDDDGELLPEGCTDNRQASRYHSRIMSPENLEASNRLFAKLVTRAHRMGIKVILDGVFNHCGSFHRWMDRERIYELYPGSFAPGAYVSAKSPYRNFFRFGKGGRYGWPYNADYEAWYGFGTLPKLNYEDSERLQEEVIRIASKWVSPPYNADGWRLDVAADLGHSRTFNHAFWRRFREAVKKANPNAIILAENYNNSSEWLQGGEWDAIMNYEGFMEPVSYFLTGMEKHSDGCNKSLLGDVDQFWKNMMFETQPHMPFPARMISMNQLSNHDHSRFMTRTNKKVGRIGNLSPEEAQTGISKAVYREAAVIQFTWPGAPTLYYGDEAGVCGFTDPDNRRTYPWGNEDRALLRFHRNLIAIHNSHKCLQRGSLIRLEDQEGVLAYARFDRREAVFVVINNLSHSVKHTISAYYAGVPKDAELVQLLHSGGKSVSTKPQSVRVNGGKVTLKLQPLSAVILLGQHVDH